MLLKSRSESNELLILRSLNTRMSLPDKFKQHYFNLKKGYEGEVIFDSVTEKIHCEYLILHDLLLKVNNTFFQIDSLIIISDTVYFYEVKNFEGDYYYEAGRLYKIPKFEITNPQLQLDRSESLLRQLLHNLGFNLPIDASVVFINPEFTLYQTPFNKPFIFTTQLNRYIQKLISTPATLTAKHKKLADKLISLHNEDSPFKQLPPYEYDKMQKGISCIKCNSLLISLEGKNCVCKKCGHLETIEAAVLRSVKELKLLFPNEKITTKKIHDWCKVVTSKKRISKILDKNFTINGVHQWSYYE